LVLDVPNEIVDETKKFVQYVMVETANKMFNGMKFKADVSIGSNWSEK
jgi:DNA polymerase I-like protein with 3'-5' exonuclease and polymerase domains